MGGSNAVVACWLKVDAVIRKTLALVVTPSTEDLHIRLVNASYIVALQRKPYGDANENIVK